MPRKTDKSFVKRLLGLRLVFVVNIVIIVLLSVSFGREFLRNYEIERDIAALQSQATALEARNLEITNLHRTLQTESFIEREARLKLGLKKPGERVIVVRDTPTNVSAGKEASDTSVDGDTRSESVREEGDVTTFQNPTKWWLYFFEKQTFVQLKYE